MPWPCKLYVIRCETFESLEIRSIEKKKKKISNILKPSLWPDKLFIIGCEAF